MRFFDCKFDVLEAQKAISPVVVLQPRFMTLAVVIALLASFWIRLGFLARLRYVRGWRQGIPKATGENVRSISRSEAVDVLGDELFECLLLILPVLDKV